MPKAILSVHDKTGLVDFARGLIDLGWMLIASGGTARLLRENGLMVTEVADYTGSAEILGGRVKTLHPAIHGGLLARSTEADRQELLALGWEPIDMVAVNLYPFEQTIAKAGATLVEAIENIDIGGVTLIRAAAKNHERVTLVCDPADYPAVLAEVKAGGTSDETRRRLAVKGFAHTAHYDAAITAYLEKQLSEDADKRSPYQLRLYPISTLRYGENPHQEAVLYGYEPDAGPLGGKILQGKALSYNNLLDLDAAWRGAVSFTSPTVVIVKHLSPCGIASGRTLAEAFPLALASDPISAFGGVIATNRPFDGEIANALGELFVECIAAPGFTPEGLEILAKRKNLRLVEMPDTSVSPLFELRSVNQGVLRQSVDMGDPEGADWRVVSKRQPSSLEWTALRFAWKACQHVKSNAIVFAQGEATVGIGGGQPNRVDCVRIAAGRAGDKSRGAVMASDAFFPFPDSVEVAAQAGITAVVAPGGSVRDEEAIAAADAHEIAMVFTGVRHFRH
jgi:phosphoribosylaminoimidazolecarboxamide formyltransferase / IMP cyclohydrolase